MVLPVRPWGKFHLWMCLLVDLVRKAAFFGHGDCLGSGLEEVVADGCSSVLGVSVNGIRSK